MSTTLNLTGEVEELSFAPGGQMSFLSQRIGLVSASFLIRSWRISLVIIVGAAAVLSPTSDVLNMLLFAAPMVVLYVISIFVAWLCEKQRVAPA